MFLVLKDKEDSSVFMDASLSENSSLELEDSTVFLVIVLLGVGFFLSVRCFLPVFLSLNEDASLLLSIYISRFLSSRLSFDMLQRTPSK